MSHILQSYLSYKKLKTCNIPQAILPLFIDEMTLINNHIGVIKKDGIVYYFQGTFPFYRHGEKNRSGFKEIVCQLLITGMASRSEIARAFKIPERSISRWLSLFKENGEGYFFKAKALVANHVHLQKKRYLKYSACILAVNPIGD
jgi:hypothetical protein